MALACCRRAGMRLEPSKPLPHPHALVSPCKPACTVAAWSASRLFDSRRTTCGRTRIYASATASSEFSQAYPCDTDEVSIAPTWPVSPPKPPATSPTTPSWPAPQPPVPQTRLPQYGQQQAPRQSPLYGQQRPPSQGPPPQPPAVKPTPLAIPPVPPSAHANLPYRVGQSSDVYRLEEGGRLVIGGVHIPHRRGCKGLSDVDVLLHTVTEAILGALCLANVGAVIPDTTKQACTNFRHLFD